MSLELDDLTRTLTPDPCFCFLSFSPLTEKNVGGEHVERERKKTFSTSTMNSDGVPPSSSVFGLDALQR